MKTGQPPITDNEDIVEQCKGCGHVIKTVRNKTICSCHRCPRINWWFEESCPQATHIEHKLKEDPIKEP